MLSFYRYAIMCGVMTDYDTLQNKIKNGYVFKVSQTNLRLPCVRVALTVAIACR